MDAGVSLGMLMTAVGVLWYWGRGLTDRLIAAATGQAAVITEVKIAIERMDANNTAALNALTASINRHDARLDRHESRLESHHDRLSAIEHGASVSGLRRVNGRAKE